MQCRAVGTRPSRALPISSSPSRLQEGGRGDVGERGMRGGRGTARAAGTNAAAQSQSHPMDTEETHGQLVCPVFGAAVVVTATVATPCGETTRHARPSCCYRLSADALMALMTKTAGAHYFLPA